MTKQILDKVQRSRKPNPDVSEEWQQKNATKPVSFENSAATPSFSSSGIMQLQRTVGNHAVMRMLSSEQGTIQRKFGTPLSENIDEVYQGLLLANPTLKRWKVEQAMKATQVFTSLEQVAAFLKINPPGGVTTTTTDQQPTTGQTPPTTDAPTEKPKWMTNLRTTPRQEPVKSTVTQPVEMPRLRTVTPTQSSTDVPTTDIVRDHKFGKGTVTVTDSMNSMVNSDNIANMKPILKSAPDFINVTFEGLTYRVKPSQDFLNVDKSAIYRDDSSAIRGAEVELMRPPINDAAAEDILVITDGHHRFVWCAYHGLPFQATFKKTRLATSLWRDVRYKPTPGNLKK